MLPNEYLYFYYFASDTVAALRNGVESRATFLLRQQGAFYATERDEPETALAAWRATRHERDETYFNEARTAAGVAPLAPDLGTNEGYEGMAIAVMEAIARDERRLLILNTPNRSALPFLDAAAVVEVPCLVGRSGVVPLAVGPVPNQARLLIETMKEVERLTIRAARERSRRIAVEALALHPLVPSVSTARRIFDGYATRHPELRDWPA
jgi:6-phospho-beta-glucosidase